MKKIYDDDKLWNDLFTPVEGYASNSLSNGDIYLKGVSENMPRWQEKQAAQNLQTQPGIGKKQDSSFGYSPQNGFKSIFPNNFNKTAPKAYENRPYRETDTTVMKNMLQRTDNRPQKQEQLRNIFQQNLADSTNTKNTKEIEDHNKDIDAKKRAFWEYTQKEIHNGWLKCELITKSPEYPNKDADLEICKAKAQQQENELMEKAMQEFQRLDNKKIK